MHDKTKNLIDEAYKVLQEYNPMTLRQCYYQLVSKHIIDNNFGQYKRLSNALVQARQQAIIPWEWIEDRSREAKTVSMWNDLEDFMYTVSRAYRKNVWDNQPNYIEVWVEKDALSGIFEDITSRYGVTLAVGRGYNSWSACKNAVQRINYHNKPTTLLYFGDFDPSGEDIVRALSEGINFFETSHEIIVKKMALTKEDVLTYNLPPDFTKKTDTRSKAFIAKYGDMAVELDALPLPILQERIRNSIEENIDMTALNKVYQQEAKERAQLRTLLT